MTARGFAMRFVVVLTAAVCLSGPAVGASPNIVFVLADDLGVNDLGCYGRKDHRTPNLDGLAATGARFTNAYAAASICSPTRAALMTGLHPARLHLTTFLPGRPDCPSQKLLHPTISQHLPVHTQTLASELKARGYATGCFGKWHLGGKGHLPTDHGFDEYYAGRAVTAPSDTEGGKGEYDLTAKAIGFVEKHKGQPFFLYLAHNAPHIPYAAKVGLVAANKKAFEPTYAAVIESLDDTVGLLLKKLDELKLADNTVVVFTSDNGGLHVPELSHQKVTHNTPYRAGKGYLYEGGLRVPALVCWPGVVRPGTELDAPVVTEDWFPTLLAVADGRAKSTDGENLTGHLKGGAAPVRPLYWHQPHYTNQGGRPAGAVRLGTWKLIEHYEDGSAELFDLAADVGETGSIAERHPDRVKELRAKLAAWRTSVGAQENTPNPAFDPKLHRPLYLDVDPSRYAPAAATAGEFARMQVWRKAMDAVVPRPKK